MDLLTGKIKSIYFRYLAAAFGSAMISCIYGIVDMAVVGQYHGPDGTAALAVVAPVWNVIYSFGLLTGIGGSVILSTLRGQGEKGNEDVQFFSASVLGAVFLSVIAWVSLVAFEKPILVFFGASDETLLSLAHEYLKPVKFVVPLFLFNQLLAAFLRNDGEPMLATAAVLAGGIFNVFGDVFFTFTLDMGVFGAGLATAIGSGISFVMLLTHFFKKKNTLRLVKPKNLFAKLKAITVTGFSTFFIDVAMGLLSIMFNRQIMKYLGSDALAVYGPIINISTFVQCCAYSVGQASQPVISTNYGAGKADRIKNTLKYSLYTVGVFGVVWTALSLAFPELYVYIFMKPTSGVLKIAPSVIRTYSLSFLLLPFNIFSTYYFQSIAKPKTAFVVSVCRGILISGALIMLLPLANAQAIWLSMPITELIVAAYVCVMMTRYTKKLNSDSRDEQAACKNC